MRPGLILGFVVFASCQTGRQNTMPESKEALKNADELFRSREYEDAGTAYEKVSELAASETESSIQVDSTRRLAVAASRSRLRPSCSRPTPT